jgi:hypothetical protein
MKTRSGFVSNSSSSSFILPKKDLTLEQLRVLTSWINNYNESEYGRDEDHHVQETTHYFFGYVSYHCGLKDQLVGLKINEDQYDLEG